MLTSEAIEVHLSYLRSGLDGVQAALPALRDKIEQTNTRIDALNERVADMADRLGQVQGSQTALFWVLSILGTLVSAVSVARDLDWI